MTFRGVIDLFCGCGGLALGAEKAGLETSLGIDIDPILSSAFQTNFPRVPVLNGDLFEIEPHAVKREYSLNRPLAILGGPPCQGFSVIGKREYDDPRNRLLRRFFRFVAFFEPAFFFMENVPGLNHGRNQETLNNALVMVSAKYKLLGPVILDAADFGAATKRPRLIVAGYDPDEIDVINETEFENSKRKSKVDVLSAIGDLPGPSTSSDEDIYLRYSTDVLPSSYAKNLRKLPRKGIGSPSALNMLSKGLLNGFQPTKHTKAVVKRFSNLAPGERDVVSKFPRLRWDKPASVLRAGTGRDKGSFQAARPVHPQSPRVITVREAARLQGFPDWFQFHRTKWHSHRMIGNSVSPIFAEAILKVFVSKLKWRSVPEAAE